MKLAAEILMPFIEFWRLDSRDVVSLPCHIPFQTRPVWGDFQMISGLDIPRGQGKPFLSAFGEMQSWGKSHTGQAWTANKVLDITQDPNTPNSSDMELCLLDLQLLLMKVIIGTILLGVRQVKGFPHIIFA